MKKIPNKKVKELSKLFPCIKGFYGVKLKDKWHASWGKFGFTKSIFKELCQLMT